MSLEKIEGSPEKKMVDSLLAIAPVSLGTVASLGRDMNLDKRALNRAIQTGFDNGWWTLNDELFLKIP